MSLTKHVRHVKHAGIGAHGFVFGDFANGAKLTGAVIQLGEIHQLAAGFLVGLIKWIAVGCSFLRCSAVIRNRLGGVLGTRP